LDGEVNLALTGLVLSKNIVQRAIPHLRRREVCCLQLPCSIWWYKHGNHSEEPRYATIIIIIIRLHHYWFRGTAV